MNITLEWRYRTEKSTLYALQYGVFPQTKIVIQREVNTVSRRDLPESKAGSSRYAIPLIHHSAISTRLLGGIQGGVGPC